jgi:hypothetical protein
VEKAWWNASRLALLASTLARSSAKEDRALPAGLYSDPVLPSALERSGACSLLPLEARCSSLLRLWRRAPPPAALGPCSLAIELPAANRQQ